MQDKNETGMDASQNTALHTCKGKYRRLAQTPFFSSWASKKKKNEMLAIAGGSTYASSVRNCELLVEEVAMDVELCMDEEQSIDEAEDEMLVEAMAERRRRQKAWKVERTGQGTRAKLGQGFVLSSTAKKSIKTLHSLGSCYMVPGIDKMKYSYLRLVKPKKSEYEVVCKWCAQGRTSG